jgi:ATP-dependent DNA ligase
VRNIQQLKAECDRLGIKVEPDAKRPKDSYEDALRDFYWLQTHPDLSGMLPQLEVQLAQSARHLKEELVEKLWLDPNWAAQKKLDGVRSLCFVGTDGSLRFASRAKSDVTYTYSEQTECLPFHTALKLPMLAGTILDGELKMNVTHVDKQVTKTKVETTISELQATIACVNSDPPVCKELQTKYGAPTFHAFDILCDRGSDVTDVAYLSRLSCLRYNLSAVEEFDPEHKLFKYVPIVQLDKKGFFEKLIAEGEEGIMLKDLRSPYEMGKTTRTWIKVKREEDIDAIITGSVAAKDDAAFAGLIGGVECSCYDSQTRELRTLAVFSAMPLEWRQKFTVQSQDGPILNPDYLGKVVVVKGQQWTKNLRMQFAVIVPQGGWDDPFRKDKAADKCTFDFAAIAKQVAAGERV